MLSMSSMAFQPNDPDFVGEWESLDPISQTQGHRVQLPDNSDTP